MAASDRMFNKLENLQNVESTVVKIFSKYKDIDTFKPSAGKNPILAIIVGAPGVGKTTKSKQILSKMKYDYDNFFNISLDAIVEKIQPYRNATSDSYYKLLAKKDELFRNMPNEERYKFLNLDAAILSDYYLQTVMSTNSKFSLNRTKKNINDKIERYRNAGLLEELGKEKNIIKKAKNAEARKKKKGKSESAALAAPEELKNLVALRLEALDYAVKNGLNILYDTTLRPKTNIIDRDIMPALEKYSGSVKYKIIIILITAEQKNIEERIRGRHAAMLEENNPYLRAINPMLTKLFIGQNMTGFNEAKEYFKPENHSENKPKSYVEKHPDTIYTPDNFIFIKKENPPNTSTKNTTRKNKYYNKALREVRTLFPNNNNF